MKSTLALIGLFALLISHVQLSKADCDNMNNFKSNSGEAKCRKGKAPDAVKKKAATPSPVTPAPTPQFDYDCDLVEALQNTSVLLSSSQQVILTQFIKTLQVTILEDITLSDEEKVVQSSYALKHFFAANVDIQNVISFQSITGFGSLFDFGAVSVDLQADFVESITTLDQNDDCDLFDAILNATSNDTQMYQASLTLIAQIRVVLMDVTFDHGIKMGRIHKILEAFFLANPSYKAYFLQINIKGFGSLESFHDVAHGYRRALSISLVLLGSGDSDSPLLSSLSAAVANTSFSLSVRNQIKNFHDKLVTYFASVTDIDLRLVYMSQQYWQMIIVEPFAIKALAMISITDMNGNAWGLFSDLTWCSQFCNNTGSCGCMSCGLGADCDSRVNLVSITAQNTTIITDVILANYNTWNVTTKTGFNTYWNLIKQCVWNVNNVCPSSARKINGVGAYMRQYNANNPGKQQILFNITINAWEGLIADFAGCSNMTVV